MYKLNNLSNGDAEITIYGDIGENWWGDGITPANVRQELNTVKGDLTVRINSFGGSMFDGQAIYNLLKDFKNKVIVKIDGVAASSASLIAMAGDEIQMPHNAMLMIHNVWTMVAGNASEMEKTAADLKAFDQLIVSVYEAKTGLKSDVILDMMNKETWMSAKEALELGFIDSIIDYQDFKASASEGKYFFNGVSIPANQAERMKQFYNFVEKEPNLMVHQNSNIMTADKIKAEYPELVTQIENKAYQNGIEAERKRILDIDANIALGYEDLANEAKKSGITAGEYAVNVLNAQKAFKTQYQTNVADDIKNSNVNSLETGQPAPTASGSQLDDDARRDRIKAGVKNYLKGNK